MKMPFKLKYKFHLFFILLAVSVFTGCDWFSTTPDNSSPKLHWKVKIYNTGAVDGWFPNTAYNGIFVAMAQVAEYETKLVGLDIQSGRQLWEWHDSFIEKEAGDFRRIAQYANKLVFAVGGRHYCIDVETGKTLWRTRVTSSTPGLIVGLGSKYYFAATVQIQNIGAAIYQGDIETGEISLVYQGEPGVLMKAPAAFLSDEGDIMLAIGESRTVDLSKFTCSQTFVLYNATQKAVVYSVTPSTGTYGSFGYREIIVQNGKMYSDIGKGFICLDVKTGKEIWRRYFFGDFLFSNFIVEGGVLYANCEDRRRYALDANTGDVKWQEDNTGTCSPIFYMNGVLYYIGGGDGKLYAVDAATGKAIWKISAPMDSRYGFSSSMPGGADGRVYCCDHYYAYCYQAAR